MYKYVTAYVSCSVPNNGESWLTLCGTVVLGARCLYSVGSADFQLKFLVHCCRDVNIHKVAWHSLLVIPRVLLHEDHPRILTPLCPDKTGKVSAFSNMFLPFDNPFWSSYTLIAVARLFIYLLMVYLSTLLLLLHNIYGRVTGVYNELERLWKNPSWVKMA